MPLEDSYVHAAAILAILSPDIIASDNRVFFSPIHCQEQPHLKGQASTAQNQQSLAADAAEQVSDYRYKETFL